MTFFFFFASANINPTSSSNLTQRYFITPEFLPPRPRLPPAEVPGSPQGRPGLCPRPGRLHRPQEAAERGEAPAELGRAGPGERAGMRGGVRGEKDSPRPRRPHPPPRRRSSRAATALSTPPETAQATRRPTASMAPAPPLPPARPPLFRRPRPGAQRRSGETRLPSGVPAPSRSRVGDSPLRLSRRERLRLPPARS